MRIKLVVPLRIPAKRTISSAAMPVNSVRITGIPPQTDAPKRKHTLFFSAAANSSSAFSATSCLLEVTTLLPAFMHFMQNVKAGSVPPMVSTTTPISGSFTMISTSLMTLSA